MSKSTAIVAKQTSLSDLRIPRRKFMIGAAAAGMTLGSALGRAYTQIASSSDYSLRIAALRLELAPGKVIDTFAYNDRVPGLVLRLREGRQVSIDIRNDTDIDDIIHWHGLYVPSAADGAMEEGSPMVERGGGTRRYTFTPKPVGTRWYHSHDVAGTDPVAQCQPDTAVGRRRKRAGHAPRRKNSATGGTRSASILGIGSTPWRAIGRRSSACASWSETPAAIRQASRSPFGSIATDPRRLRRPITASGSCSPAATPRSSTTCAPCMNSG